VKGSDGNEIEVWGGRAFGSAEGAYVDDRTLKSPT